ncbi:class I SAM-dependent methyltransferase [Acidovorax sp.]|uniref:class I SAM-dependent methyltransferase n=1 Tax=Acidovorax sp. TaxID=1872122 RepID=UPI002ACEC3A8|nr:class I SAM-dependent methyltransferase [Acidovorax sp.]MDZ7864991.1 class I SAM-dependent methyltransferase [Acidovorax sp.]
MLMPLRLLPWPLPALLAWAGAWLLYLSLLRAVPPVAALVAASLLGTAASVLGASWWRRGLIALGFPLSLALTGMASLPAWAWLVPLALLLLVYPLNAWRDAPLFPTPHHALQALAVQAPLARGARVLDAGCGVGDGLIALRHAYPETRLEGLEWSWPLRLACALRCPWARVRRGDMWAADWSGYQMVYLFQRPESMARAAAKAQAEMAAGAWLVSLEFAVPGLLPSAQLRAPGGRVVWIYRLPLLLEKGA